MNYSISTARPFQDREGDVHGFEGVQLAATAVTHSRLHIRLVALSGGACNAQVSRISLADPPQNKLPLLWAQWQTARSERLAAKAELDRMTGSTPESSAVRRATMKAEKCIEEETALTLQVHRAWASMSEAFEACEEGGKSALLLANPSTKGACDAEGLLALLLRIESVAHVLVWYDAGGTKLARVELPRLALSFETKGGNLCCEQEEGYYVSDRRDISFNLVEVMGYPCLLPHRVNRSPRRLQA